MKIKFYLLLWVSLFSLGLQSQQENPKAKITQFVPSYGRSRPWVSLGISFESKVSQDFYHKFLEYLEKKLKPNIVGATIKRDNSFLFKLADKSMTQKDAQSIVDEANQILNQPLQEQEAVPTIAAPQEILRQAIQKDSRDDVQRAVAAGAVINYDNPLRSPLLHAFLDNKIQAAIGLLEAGANPNLMYQGKKLVHYFLLNSDAKKASILIQFGADYSGIVEGDQDVFNFIINNYSKNPYLGSIADQLIKKGHDLKPFYTTKDLSKNLYYQSLTNDLEQYPQKTTPPYYFFTSHGASINQIFTLSDGTTWTPLLIVIDKHADSKLAPKAPSVLHQLLNAGADINQEASPIPQKGPQNALSFALIKQIDPSGSLAHQLFMYKPNFARSVVLFLNSGGNPNSTMTIQLDGSWTLLGYAVNKQDIQTVKTLLNAGANPNMGLNSSNDKTLPQELVGRKFRALELALKKDSSVIIELLLEYGA